jgi:hypothetical protein
MTVTTTIARTPGGVLVEIVRDGVPDVISRADHEAGTRMALAKLASLVEGQPIAHSATPALAVLRALEDAQPCRWSCVA